MNRKDLLAMLLKVFNESPNAALAAELRPCIDVDRWVQEIIHARPYASAEEILERARTAADPFTAEEVAAAMAHHPRIGERAAGSGEEAALSRKEQRAIDPADEATAAALARGNAAYEAKFGRVFLIRAAGRPPAEILAALDARLHHSPAEEDLVVAEQLREIALLRLQGVLDP